MLYAPSRGIWTPPHPVLFMPRVPSIPSIPSVSGSAAGKKKAASGGGGPWVPALSGFAYQFDASRDTYTDTGLTTPGTTDGATILGWKDQSANVRHATKPAGAGAVGATLKTGQVNSLPCLRGAATAYLRASFALAQPVTVFLVLRINTWSSGAAYIIDGVGGDTMDLLMRTSSPNFGMFAGAHGPQNGDLAVSAWGIVCAVFDGASSRSRINAGSSHTGSAGTSTTGGITFFNQGGAAGASSTGGAVDIAAAIGYPSALSTGDEQTVRDDLNARFAIF